MIREMREEDLGRIEELEKELFPDHPWSAQEFLNEMKENPFSNLYVYEEDGEIRGYIDWWITYEQAQIANVAAAKSDWGRGIGSELIRQSIKDAEIKGCEVMSLEVRISNHRAISLYEKFGFIKAARRRHYYENGEDAWLMILPLGGFENDTDTGN